MFDFDEKQQPEFGVINADDDKDIEVKQVKQERSRGILSETLLLVRDIIFVLVIMILLGVFIAQPVVVEGTSMLPNLHEGERLIVNKLIYYKFQSVSWGHIERGDIVVFWYPNDPDKSYVKRVIGLPGDNIEIRNGKVLINGNELQENYLDSTYNQSGANLSKTVEKHHYFVMGDNRDNSSDSRTWGLVPEKYIYGKAFFRYWRPSNFGFLDKGDFQLQNSDSIDNKAQNRPVQNYSTEER
ncbi:MAG: signal peptidase I [Pyrinomonadaceae bacterium]|jgi:signal peptidase I|nr:signal peptidase I [Pyrinomonadaceae bacterium]